MSNTVLIKILFCRSPHRRKDSDRQDSKRQDKEGKGGGKEEEEEEEEPDDEETLLMKQMMGFSKFNTTKVNTVGYIL